jgi:sugar lactone lactonase YvrE
MSLMTLLEEHAEKTSLGEEALIREARQLRRRRWGIGLIVALILVAIAVVYATSSRSTTPPGRSAPTTPLRKGTGTAPKTFVPTQSPDLIQPTTLAAEPDGDVLILDSSRDQILRLTPTGTLSVFAGDGRQGFTGDGGPAVHAELNLSYFSQSGLAVAPSGNVYFVDDGGCRLRTINTRGIIRTIVNLPLVHVPPSGTSCQLNGVAVSPSGVVYVSTNSDIERVTPRGTLAWVAGAPGAIANEPKNLTASTAVLSPGSITFNARGDLDIWNWEPRVMYQLSPTGTITNLGWVYATQLTTTPSGSVLVGTHFGEIDAIAPQGTRVASYRDVNPEKVKGLNWRHVGFQENGIAVTPSGVIYVDNADGNGYGAGTALVRIAKDGRAELAPIRTPLSKTLPAVGAPGFPASLYPAPRRSMTSILTSCPSNTGLDSFTPAAIRKSIAIATHYRRGQYASGIVVTDRSWWTGTFESFLGGDLGAHWATNEMPAKENSDAHTITAACGDGLVRDSIAVSIRQSGYGGESGTLYLLDRDGRPLIYYAVIASN